MSFEKVIPSQIAEYKVFDVSSTEELIKVASDIDFPEDFVYDSDFLYMWIRIVSAGQSYGPNKNGDYFPENELVSYWETFKDAHPFKNHENKNVENAIGKIITVRWNPVMKCIELLKGIDKKRAPEVVRGYAKGYLTDVSMGCKVPYTVCSVCGNKARKRSEFCDHVRFHRLQMLGNGERVFEINYKPRFHDSSTVLNGAERVAKAFYIIDSQPDGVPSFKKTASADGTTHYIRLTDEEMEKVASVQSALHPLLKEEALNKLASVSPMMRKIAELEKELTGKLLNVVSSSTQKKIPQVKQMLQVIKFLTEKRLDESSLKNIATTVKEVAKENGVPTSRAFATLIGVAELMGIEFFPKELHTLLRYLTDAKLNNELDLSSNEGGSIFPSDFSDGIQKAVVQIEPAQSFNSPASLLNIYNESAHDLDGLMKDPFSFLSSISDGDEMNDHPPVRMIRIIKKTLSPMVTRRSFQPQHLYPRLSVVINGHKPIVGGDEAKQDLDLLTNPSTPGDLLARLAYGIYERMRPNLMGTKLIKIASDEIDGIEKNAYGLIPNPNRRGLSTFKLALGAVPLAYAASAYEKSRRNNGDYLTDGQNFISEHPGMMAVGGVLAGKPISKVLHSGLIKGTELAGTGAGKAGEIADKVKSQFTYRSPHDELGKYSETSLEGLIKEAESYPTGDFNIFNNNEVMQRYMNESGANGEQASAVKMASLLSLGGMKKEAFEIMDHYNIPNQEKERLFKIAVSFMDEEMDKAAEDFTNNLILSVIGDNNPLAPTLPGRAIDAFVLKKLTKMAQPKQPQQPAPNQMMKGEKIQ